jgi:RNA polymerase sigma factor (sigma-70 family)
MNAREAESLILNNMPLVWRAARAHKRRAPHHIDIDDIVSSGTIGLIKAASKYDESQGQFENFAAAKIRGEILEAHRSLDHLSRNHRKAVKKQKAKEVVQINMPNWDAATEKNYDKQPLTWDDLREQRRSLTFAERIFLALYCIEKFTIREIGQVFGVQQATAYEKFTAIKRKLRNHQPA